MQKRALREIKEYLVQNHRSRMRKKIVAGLACAAVLGTAYALMLPAIAMEGEPACGMAEHVHTDECYQQVTSVPVKALSCGFAVHQHAPECEDDGGNLVCGLADYAVHQHDSACYDENGALVCPLDELEAHEHEESCWEIPETEPGHVHTDDCYEAVLTCTVPAEQVHTHTPECYQDTRTEELVCGLEESQGHTHGEGCLDENGAQVCELEPSEGHTHGEDCYGVEHSLICGCHEHTDACYGQEPALVCGQEAEPAEAAPAEPELICGKKEVILHAHSEEDGCYETDEDGAAHLICEKTVVLEHPHTGDCFTAAEQPVDTETLTCGMEEVHRHGESCFDENGQPVCGLEESEGHRHSARCYGTWELVCGMEEHTHGEVCRVMGLIGALPGQQDIEVRMAAFAEAGDEAGSDGYLTGLREQVQAAWTAYDALPEEDRAKVTNISRLTELDWLRNFTLEEAPVGNLPTVTGDNLATVTEETENPDTRTRLNTALFGVGQGYVIEAVKYYKIEGPTGSTATVEYPAGSGLNATDANAKVFVYDLGTDGREQPKNCNAEGTVANGKFDTFTFTPSVGSGPRVYAFISARPAELKEMGIYVGEKQGDGSWIAYDTGDKNTANVRATITLPADATVPEGYSPFIRKINPGEGSYPRQDAIENEVGQVNGWQCYTIRWITRKEDDGQLHMIPLNLDGTEQGRKTVTVKIEYLKDDARLEGPKGARKLLIFNSSRGGDLVDQVADTVKDVTVAGDQYTGFTFEASHAGPYVFVSKTLEKAYVKQLEIMSIEDGSGHFDLTGNLAADGKVDVPGNDNSKNNNVVRSYDTIAYTLKLSLAARQESVTEEQVKLYFEVTLLKSATSARFDRSKLGEAQEYNVEYLNHEGDVVMVMTHDEKFYAPKRDENGKVVFDENGFAVANRSGPEISFNQRLNGSQAGPNSYKVTDSVVERQRLVGWRYLNAKEGEDILAKEQSIEMGVQVRNADNEEVFAPTFKVWLEGNEENYGPESLANQGDGDILTPAKPENTNVVVANGDKAVTVSAGTNFNLQLKKNTDMSYKNWFDFSSGDVVAPETRKELVRLAKLDENHGKSDPAEFTENGSILPENTRAEYANYRYGRITCYGITLQLYNDTDNDPEGNRASKGLRGLSLPVGDITFDLNFQSKALSGGNLVAGAEEHYTPILWEYNENIPVDFKCSGKYVDPGRESKQLSDGSGLGNSGRRLYWDGETRSSYAKGGGPSNYKDYHGGCYYGGDWALVNNGTEVKSRDAMNLVASPTAVTGTGAGTTYHFKVSDYDFDFDNQHFPTQDAGNSGDVLGYNTYARCFSAGCVQVLSVFPMVQEVDEAEIFLNTTVSNLKLETRAEQELAPEQTDTTGYGHEVNQKDNTDSDQIVVYAPGHLTKGSSFNGKYKNNVPTNTSEGFLGTEYWTTSYDCSTFAGDDIWIVSYGMIGSGSDYRTRSMNLLQLFDSRALSIRDELPDVCQNWDEQYDKKGTATFLYAADPDYPKGYDTNEQGILEYMNGVREEDLRYYTSLEDLKDAGYTCVGVLMELRGCDLLGGKYQYMRIPVKVNGEDKDLVKRTVATVNTFRVWSWDLVDTEGQPITWANGQWDGKQNNLDGFVKPTNIHDSEGYSGELANGVNESPPYYVKTEYQDGHQVEGTHAGGTLAGNSLLILSYTANINVEVANKASDAGIISYNQGNGETVVEYKLTDISTKASDLTGQTVMPTTKLTIKTVLDEDRPDGRNPRISIESGSYRIKGYKTADAQNETEFIISSDSENSTALFMLGTDDKRYEIKVYAELGPGGQSVSFVIDGAPVGLAMPDITFKANFAPRTDLRKEDTIKTSAYISGTGDNRAYDQAKGNTDNVTVNIVMGSGANLTKRVEERYIELNGTIHYHVLYTNDGSKDVEKVFFYDLMPTDGDIRDSHFTGTRGLRWFGVKSEGGAGVPAKATVYYSTTEYWTLYNMVRVFGGTTGINDKNAEKVEQMLNDPDHFRVLGTVNDTGEFTYDRAVAGMQTDELITFLNKVTGVYAKVENLKPQQTIHMEFIVKTENNKADDWYRNIANSWNTESQIGPLTSTKVETQVVSRRISGVVWFDKNLNGVRETNEPLLDGVTATLFKKDADGKYQICEKDVTDSVITEYVTGPNGAYSFDALAEGDYIVAFSGEKLKEFTGATTYQEGGQNRTNTSDGKPTAELTVAEIDKTTYPYYIHYSSTSDEPSMPLHRIDEMGTVSLKNGVEEYANQDLGLIVASDPLPKTGGPGTALYTFLGIALMAGAALLPRRRREKSV